jgi:hypothetical protein
MSYDRYRLVGDRDQDRVTLPSSASPAWADGLADVVTEMTVTAEGTVMKFMAGTLGRGLGYDDWAVRRWQDAAGVLQQTDRTVTRLQHDAEAEIDRVLAAAYKRGHGTLSTTPTTLLQRLLAQLRGVWARFRGSARTAYSRIVGAGSTQRDEQSRRGVVQRELDHLADRGLTGFTDTAGRQWSAPGYVKQAVSHATGTAVMDGWFAANVQQDRLLVIVPETPTTCPVCAPWLGRVLSILGGDPDHPSVAEARASGLWHPNCQHPAEQWFPGYAYKPVPLQIRRTREALYVASQRQRAIERTLAMWERRRSAALDDVARARANRKVRQWQSALKAHIRLHGSTPRIASA